MAWMCDVCGQKIHLKKINNRNVPVRCPLEPYKDVKSFYTVELKQMLSMLFFDEFPLEDSYEGLSEFSKIIPKKTIIMNYVKKYENVFTKTLIIQAKLETFFIHFNRVLINIYDDNKIHFVDSPQQALKSQFNYLWLSPTTLRECYFREGRSNSRFKSMTELGIPSLVIYPIGNVSSVKNNAWGDMTLDLITHRESLGRPTWIINTKGFSQCPEIQSSEKLRSFLTNSSRIPTLKLDEDSDIDNGSLISNDRKNISTYGI